MSLHRLRAWPPVMPLRRVAVQGESMAPALLPGDRLLVSALHGIHVDDVVAVRDPRHAHRVLVKRVASIDTAARTLVVLGDNPAASTDSRAFGPVGLASVLGRCMLRYHPEARRGPLPRKSQADS